MKVFWPQSPVNVDGNILGYATHNTALRKEVAKIIDVVDNEYADDAFVITAPMQYAPVEGAKRNWLFTMFESPDIHPSWKARVQKADYVVVPCTWCKEVFSEFYDPDRIFVVNHGVDAAFAYKERKWKKQKYPFRFLWLGAPNTRKGWGEIMYIWDSIFKNVPNCELYIKSTGLMTQGIRRKANVILDGRKLPLADLVKVYHSAHAFVFPSWGEGFGLTLAEAMRTGLPCVSPVHTGIADFFDSSVGFVVDHKIAEAEFAMAFKKFFPDEEDKDATKTKLRMAQPDIEQIAEKMMWIMKHYDKALLKGRRAYARMRNFTWKRSAETLIGFMDNVINGRRAA